VLLELQLMELATMITPLLVLTLRTLATRPTQELTAICQEVKIITMDVMQHLLAELALPVLELTKLDTLLTRTQTPFPQALLDMETPQRALTHPTWLTRPILESIVTDPRSITTDVTLPLQAESALLDMKPTNTLATMIPQPSQTQHLVLTPQTWPTKPILESIAIVPKTTTTVEMPHWLAAPVVQHTKPTSTSAITTIPTQLTDLPLPQQTPPQPVLTTAT